jgi:hypothetical protein
VTEDEDDWEADELGLTVGGADTDAVVEPEGLGVGDPDADAELAGDAEGEAE